MSRSYLAFYGPIESSRIASLYSLVYEVEEVVLMKVGLPSLWVQAYHGKINHKAMPKIVTFLEEKSEMTTIQATTY